MTRLMNYEAVYRTAPATPGLLMTSCRLMTISVCHRLGGAWGGPRVDSRYLIRIRKKPYASF